jgi:UPF0042 nucleotide-binding protein
MRGDVKDHSYTIIVTGLSGSGKSVALNALEDSGFYCVDNLPVTLIKTFVDLCHATPSITKIAIGVDIREGKFLADLSRTALDLRLTQKLEILFLEASDDILLRRFKETRRPHPLGFKDLKKAVLRETELLQPTKMEADSIINTSTLNPHDLRNLIVKKYSGSRRTSMAITLVSFGFKYGIPSEVDLLFDVRFLPNPNYIEELRAFPGTSDKVKSFIYEQGDTTEFLDRLYPLLIYAIPLYIREGRSYLTIGIGCTGGKHRSPAIVEKIEGELKEKGFSSSVVHRDLSDA